MLSNAAFADTARQNKKSPEKRNNMTPMLNSDMIPRQKERKSLILNDLRNSHYRTQSLYPLKTHTRLYLRNTLIPFFSLYLPLSDAFTLRYSALLAILLSAPAFAKPILEKDNGRILGLNNTQEYIFDGRCLKSPERFYKNSSGDWVINFETDTKACAELAKNVQK